MMNRHLQQKSVSLSLSLSAHCTNIFSVEKRILPSCRKSAYRRNFCISLNTKMEQGQYYISLIRSLNEKTWQKFWAIHFFPQKRNAIYEQSLLQFYQGTGTHWKIELQQNYKSNGTEKSEKSVGCDLFAGLVHARIFKNFTYCLYKYCSNCQ